MSNIEAHVPTESMVIQKAISFVSRQHSITIISAYRRVDCVRV